MSKPLDLVLRPLIDDNPITLQILGLCSALALPGLWWLSRRARG